MYIPTSFFGAGQGCITATGGITGSYISGGILWKYHQFDASTYTTSSFNVISGSTLYGKLLIVGGGGSGGAGGGTNLGTTAAGGGGAGGVVYYEQFPILTGSYSINVGKGGTGVFGQAVGGTYIANQGNNGATSSVQFPYGAYPPFSSSLLTAYGGGGGGVAGNGVSGNPIPGAGGASGGGNAQGNASSGYLPSIDSSSCISGFGNIYGGPQGNFGGSIPSDVYLGFNTGWMVTGGGGAGDASLSVLNTGGANGSPTKTDGGNGIQNNIDGTLKWYAGGGASNSSTYGASGAGYGAAQGPSASWGGGSNAILGSTGGAYSADGGGGVIIFAYPLCPFANDCVTTTGNALNTSATLYFINCYTNVTTSLAINPYTTASVCSRPFAQYPYIVGTGATLTTGSSCTSQTITLQQTASIAVPYYAFNSAFSPYTASYQIKYINNGVAYTGSISGAAITPGIKPIVQTLYRTQDVMQNGYNPASVFYEWAGPIPGGCPTFAYAAGAGSSSILYPSGGEAWYVNVTNTNIYSDLPSSSAAFFYYVNESGSLINDSVAFGQTKTILTQTPITSMNFSSTTFDNESKINYTPISKFSGSVTVPQYLVPGNTQKHRFTMKMVNKNTFSYTSSYSQVAAATTLDINGNYSASVTGGSFNVIGSTYTMDAYNLPFQLATNESVGSSNCNTWITNIQAL